MIYPASARPQLDPALFERPTSEYRGAPFWAWNGRLEKNQLLWQLAVFQEMGFGGAHLHVRVGLETPYLGDEFMAMVRACTTECERLGLKAWLYDEDRWPSGAAGGLVTRDPRYRLAHLLFTPRPYGGSDDTGPGSYYGARVGRSGGGSSTLVRRFAVTLRRGKLSSWRMLAPDSANSTDGEAQRGETHARESVRYLYNEPAP